MTITKVFGIPAHPLFVHVPVVVIPPVVIGAIALVLLLFAVALVVMLLDRRTRGAWPFVGREAVPEMGRVGLAGLIGVTILVALGTNIRRFQIGDSGAKATWQRVHLVGQPAGLR